MQNQVKALTPNCKNSFFAVFIKISVQFCNMRHLPPSLASLSFLFISCTSVQDQVEEPQSTTLYIWVEPNHADSLVRHQAYQEQIDSITFSDSGFTLTYKPYFQMDDTFGLVDTVELNGNAQSRFPHFIPKVTIAWDSNQIQDYLDTLFTSDCSSQVLDYKLFPRDLQFTALELPKIMEIVYSSSGEFGGCGLEMIYPDAGDSTRNIPRHEANGCWVEPSLCYTLHFDALTSITVPSTNTSFAHALRIYAGIPEQSIQWKLLVKDPYGHLDTLSIETLLLPDTTQTP